MTKVKEMWLWYVVLTCAVATFSSTPAYAQKPAGTPDSVVFYSARDGSSNAQIYLMNPDGTDQVRITHDLFSDVDPDISPNRQQIVFTSNGTGNGDNDIFLLDRWGLR